jgi:membrane fusion protein, copper/silver efflux system
MDDGKTATGATRPSAGAPAVRKKVVYRSTMNPGEISDHPGKDSMGMDMVAVEEEEGAAGAPPAGLAGVRIPFRKQQLIGVRTETVRKAPFIRTINAVGRVAVDETRLRHIHTKIEGWIETLHVSATGEKVEAGQPLLSVYSPELLATQEEYLLALRSRAALAAGAYAGAVKRADELVESSRRRMLLYDLTPGQIAEVEKTGQPSRTVTLHAPVSGYVLQRNVTGGEKITPDTTLLDIADLSRVWVIASVYEYELPFVKVGEPAVVTLAYLPGRSFQGKVGFIYPVLEGSTRTIQVRIEFANPGMELKPDMFVQVALQGNLGERLTVPDGAVISSGTRNIVFVAKGEGYFEPREVQIGLRLPDAVEILGGLSEGEMVVASGNFLIDSESRLKSALEAAAPPAPEKPAEPEKER